MQALIAAMQQMQTQQAQMLMERFDQQSQAQVERYERALSKLGTDNAKGRVDSRGVAKPDALTAVIADDLALCKDWGTKLTNWVSAG